MSKADRAIANQQNRQQKIGVAEFRDDSCGVGILPAQKIQGTGRTVQLSDP
ncbi:hypothetical protein [Scytonema sp. HK-05]|uniref:hypothetical protein n=1 Tax=Scytonema sp. HK-05 TaxID=1137095 RepID=UPI00130104A1|nr:hypothetical protein [Scytonema sp. HK-05]